MSAEYDCRVRRHQMTTRSNEHAILAELKPDRTIFTQRVKMG
jgi:hypothetical protein